MSKKHSSKFFRAYFAPPNSSESESPSRVPGSTTDGPATLNEVVAATGDTARAVLDAAIQGGADCLLVLAVPDATDGSREAHETGVGTL